MCSTSSCPSDAHAPWRNTSALATPAALHSATTRAAAAAAARVVAECNAAGVANALVLRQGAWASLGQEEVEHTAKASVIAQVAEVRGLTKQLDQSGLPERLPRPLARAAETVLKEAA